MPGGPTSRASSSRLRCVDRLMVSRLHHSPRRAGQHCPPASHQHCHSQRGPLSSCPAVTCERLPPGRSELSPSSMDLPSSFLIRSQASVYRFSFSSMLTARVAMEVYTQAAEKRIRKSVAGSAPSLWAPASMAARAGASSACASPRSCLSSRCNRQHTAISHSEALPRGRVHPQSCKSHVPSLHAAACTHGGPASRHKVVIQAQLEKMTC